MGASGIRTLEEAIDVLSVHDDQQAAELVCTYLEQEDKQLRIQIRPERRFTSEFH